MSSQDTRALIATALERFAAEVPALRQLKIVMQVELRTHGGD
ncbi:MAG: hypothetical protein QOH13_11, partial [Thermoleophilaceae bacterium]|nr:hypothetical protein [Thermoleophilaceae bacterium]